VVRQASRAGDTVLRVRPATARFTSGDLTRPGWRPDGESIELDVPRAVHVAARLDEVIPVLAEADRAAADGRWAAVMVAYDAAAAFDPAMPRLVEPRPADAVPLAWVAVFDPAAETDSAPRRPSVAGRVPPDAPVSAWHPALSREAFAVAIHRVAAHIAAGDTYQVNYTFPLIRDGSGPVSPAQLDAWLDALCGSHEAGYGARLDLGRHVVLSASPELFVERHGRLLRARPMKGTAPRGRWLEEDAVRRDALVASEKARAENVMIVDLLRNDLGRIAETGSVEVRALFDAERYPTVWQLTSTIEARLPESARAGVVDLLRALFPCGSVTGAPKIRTMEIIAALEPAPRGVYTGAIGLVRPGGDAVFSVAIRTIVVERETGRATLGIGAGIVADSRADDEYAECLLKGAFAGAAPPPGAPAVVCVPPASQRDFELLETVRVEDGAWRQLARHLDRMMASAAYFGFPWDRADVEAAIADAEVPMDGLYRGRIRLLPSGEPKVEVLPFVPFGAPRRIALARDPVDANDVFLCHKTTRRGVYTRAQATRPDVDDVVLWNTRGEITESTIANIVVEIAGERWTPARTSGLLNGVARGLLLESGQVREGVLTRADLRNASRIWLVSALRGEAAAVAVGSGR
jgi:para-aminobenzoate synthetase/4-amino-4-deoxychorismate lyase